jgi:hypothetical protein
VFRRLFWLITGASFGFGLSFWLTRFLRETVERYSPERVSGNVAGALKALGADVRAAASEGRMAMRETEEQLRGEAHNRSRPLV